MESSFTPLDVSEVMRSYRPSKRRVIILDYGGTICATAKRSIAYFAHATKVRFVPPDATVLKVIFYNELCFQLLVIGEFDPGGGCLWIVPFPAQRTVVVSGGVDFSSRYSFIVSSRCLKRCSHLMPWCS